MQITRFGHSALLVETSAARILVDPGTLSVPETFELTDLSAIVVTHQHADHLDQARLPGLLAANPDALLIADPQTAGLVEVGRWEANTDGLEVVVGDLTLRGVGEQHAEILPAIPRIANVGVLVAADAGPRLFHPGDSLASVPAGVDVLAAPLSAPWCKLRETVDFVTSVAPTTLIPIHDGTLSGPGRSVYWNQLVAHGGVADARLVEPLEAVLV